MPSPACQYWIDLGIKLFGIVATLFAVFVALFGAWLRNWLWPPELKISLARTEGDPSTVVELDQAGRPIKLVANGFWYHVQLDSETRWNPVTDALVYCLSIEEQDAADKYKPIWTGRAPLIWRHNRDALAKKIGPPAECDLCHVLSAPVELRLSPMIQGQMPAQFKEATKLRLTLQARGIEADSNLLRVDISWDGKWTDDRERINHHLVVNEVEG